MHFVRDALVHALSHELNEDDSNGSEEPGEWKGKKEQGRTGNLYVIVSSPRPSRALFPWSPSQQNASVRDIMVLYTEPLKESDSSSQMPAFALEASLYTNNKHHHHHNKSKEQQEEKEDNNDNNNTLFPPRSSFLYISKLDTTGLFPDRPSIARKLTSTFIRTLNCDHTFIFARAQAQYLFPGSVNNGGKRLMDDRKLAAWWTRTIDQVSDDGLVVYWVLAGYSFDEARQLLTGRIPPFEEFKKQHLDQENKNMETEKKEEKKKEKDQKGSKWIYGHPYKMYGKGGSIADLIPSFADDPKARYLCSLCSSRIPPAGEEGDMDEHYESICRYAPAAQMNHKEMCVQDRARERRRLDEVEVDDFWEGMGWRQECCDGHVAAFFVISKTKSCSSDEAIGEQHAKKRKSAFDDDRTLMLPYSVYVQFWSSLHNIDYHKVESAKESFDKWSNSLQHSYPEQWKNIYRCIPLAPISSLTATTTSKPEKRELSNHNEPASTTPTPVVNVLAPRKKKKTTM